MCYGHVCSVGSATRPHAANCVAIFPWASSGASRTARSASTPTNPCAPPSRPSLLASPSWDRYVASGYGSVARVCVCPCGCTTALKSAGSTQATSPSIISSPIRSTQAPTHMARAVMRSPSTLPVYARSARANCRARNGKCSSRTTMRALSIGTPMRLIARGSPPTLIHARINQVAVP